MEYHPSSDVFQGSHRRVQTTLQGGTVMKLKRPVILLALFVVGLGMIAADFAVAQPFRPPQPGRGRVIVPRGPAAVLRAPVVTHRNWPLKRAPRPVIVRPPRVVNRPRVSPRLFLPPAVFGAVVVGVRNERGRQSYSRESLVWQDSETLYREDDWTEFTLDCNVRGTKLWFEILEGRVQIDWVEVVFDNGEVQIVEFPERSLGRGIYELLDFRDGRRVDYVRIVAKTTSREAELTLWMER